MTLKEAREAIETWFEYRDIQEEIDQILDEIMNDIMK